jgi:hypothetical protein
MNDSKPLMTNRRRLLGWLSALGAGLLLRPWARRPAAAIATREAEFYRRG